MSGLTGHTRRWTAALLGVAALTLAACGGPKQETLRIYH